MPINLIVAVTDSDWFEMLRAQPNLAEVNFWAPSGANFRALQPGEMFLFKLHAPRNVIVGGGIFAHANALPCSLAWEAFGQSNGAHSAREMRARIARYRKLDPNDRSDFEIGCRILTQPFFFEERDWIPVPPSWSPNIVSFKTYSTGDADGLALWEAVNSRRSHVPFSGADEPQARYGEPHLIKPRLGQGAFRVLVTASISAAASSRRSGRFRRWRPPTSAPMATAAATRRAMACCCGATSTACSMPATSRSRPTCALR